MFSKAIVFFALVAAAVAEGPHVGFKMPPIMPSYNGSPSLPQVVGGEEAPVGAYPFIVSLQMFSQHFCAGSILNENWVITAGHCVNAVNENFELLTVHAGKHNLRETENTEQVVGVTKAYVHEGYPGKVGPYDVGLLKLASTLKLNDRVQYIELASPGSDPTGEAWLCGWGSTSTTNNSRMPDKLQHVKLEYLARPTCSDLVKLLTGSSPVHETNVCTAPKSKPTSACSGDSGGPLISRDGQKQVLTGLASWAIMPCGTAGAPSVYARVSKFNDWISQKIGNKPRGNGASRFDLGPGSWIVLIILSFLTRYT